MVETKPRRAAFTLIELMLVVLVLAVVSAIAIPSYVNSRQHTQASACEVNRKAFDQAKLLWMMDSGRAQGDDVYFRDLLPDYIKTPPACPLQGTYELSGLEGDTTCSAHPNSGNSGRNTRL
jgi:prepilin-type N-terminal cleavage/methylation domain-containing protein